MFEALVERDLRIYIEALGGKLYHYRNNINGVEVDAIVELAGGEYGAIEIKLGSNEIDIVALQESQGERHTPSRLLNLRR